MKAWDCFRKTEYGFSAEAYNYCYKFLVFCFFLKNLISDLWLYKFEVTGNRTPT